MSEQPPPLQYSTSMEELKESMLRGEQSAGVNYYQHGQQVADQFTRLLDLLKHHSATKKIPHDNPRKRWVLPQWIVNHQQFIFDALSPHAEIYKVYHVWHDCGKPLVKQWDNTTAAAVHYPDHALISSNAWLAAGGDAHVAVLIENDMVPHHIRSVEEVKQLARDDANFLVLMVTAVCALHVCSPSAVEGEACSLDLTSTSGFKIKMKRLNYYGKVMMRVLMTKPQPV